MRRRQVLATGGLALGLGTAGCTDVFETGPGELGSGGNGGPQVPPLVEDRPDAVYVPTHVEGMEMVDMASAGRYRFALSYSYPHRFWLVTGGRPRKVEIGENDTVHLMLSVWDDETGTILPSSNTPVVVRRDGETTVDKSMWGMLSQNMGVHFGDNVDLTGDAFEDPDGTYEVEVDFGPLQTRQLGDFAGALGESAGVTMTLEFSQADLQEVAYRRLDDRAGERGAVDPMDMDMLPSGQLPASADLPGQLLGEGESGDAVFAAVEFDSVPAGADGEGTYLAVSSRTPDNRYPIPRMGLSASIDGGDPITLAKSTHPDLGYHYGAVVDELTDGGDLEISVESPPTVARHEGYETAFLEFEPVTISP